MHVFRAPGPHDQSFSDGRSGPCPINDGCRRYCSCIILGSLVCNTPIWTGLTYITKASRR